MKKSDIEKILFEIINEVEDDRLYCLPRVEISEDPDLAIAQAVLDSRLETAEEILNLIN